ncbi:tRNA uridine-5-carboxymethylaminomethyl(34) synthesis enzyme MnmG [Bacteroidia bacterium]|nr:tRNA uridine-5-carboxymethylaminomethyl(34) synthesis enzyme MnmG [Bacteroidia bacterium]
MQFNQYDVLVIGGGHAGCEAAHAAAKMGSNVLLVTMNMETIAKMSCNPAMGGVAKGQIVREIDALGGMSGIISDKTMIQFRMLNRSKGAAMWSPRAQSDRYQFSEMWRAVLEANQNVSFWQDAAEELIIENKQVKGIITKAGHTIHAKSVILTTGTFMGGNMHIGKQKMVGGRMGEPASKSFAQQLVEYGFTHARMKTGTPPRVDGRTIDFSLIEEQPGDVNPGKFSYTSTPKLLEQRSCHITYTNPRVHEILQEGFEDSPMFNGRIQGIGPRYCPSIEDKINRFAERDRHQIFVEPEGWTTVEYYINGFSTSLPADVQQRAMHEIVGFKNAKMFRPGYAIEYDFFHPTQLKNTLETKTIESLYFAGQINGTTGYEEAACQGLMAGINAHLKNHKKEAFILNRGEAYIGVLIDDLINKGTDEPYRMFTSRAEYRLLLRQDNADERLTYKSFNIGLAEESRIRLLEKKSTNIRSINDWFKENAFKPKEINPILEGKKTSTIQQKTVADKLLARPQIKISDFGSFFDFSIYSEEELTRAEINVKYKSYIEKEKEMVDKLIESENLKLDKSFNYSSLSSLSAEAREKLNDIKPENLGQASRISGVSPADMSILLLNILK